MWTQGFIGKRTLTTFWIIFAGSPIDRRSSSCGGPWLPDAKDDMILELAVAAGCEAIVTHNRRDFEGAERLGVHVQLPREFLRSLEES
jgi:hypothetical protein